MHVIRTDVSDSKAVEARGYHAWGVGGQWDAMASLGVRLEWQQYHDVGGDSLGGKENINVISVGALWRFR